MVQPVGTQLPLHRGDAMKASGRPSRMLLILAVGGLVMLVGAGPTLRAYITDEQDLEKLRVRSMFYFDVARDLKRARTDDSSKVFKDASTLAFFVAALFAVAGVMQVLYARARKKAGLVE